MLIRADGSPHLGLGHIMRCLALAQGFEGTGAKVIFVTRDYEPAIIDIIRRYDNTVQPIPRSCSLEEDLLLTSEAANRYSAKLIVTDLGNADTEANPVGYGEYLQGLKDRGKFLITIDELNNIRFPSDIVINPHYGAENRNYEPVKGTKLLLGPDYFIFRQEFIEAASVDREIKRDARNILVTMGGSDLLGLNLKVAKALTRLPRTAALKLRIVLGIDYTGSKKRELKQSLADFAGRYELIQGSDSMAGLMLGADLAITGGGLTRYETAVTGTPSIIISQAAHQADYTKQFEKEGTALNLGFGTEICEEHIVEAVVLLMRDYAFRAKMSKRGKQLIDGKGIERIFSEIPSEVWS